MYYNINTVYDIWFGEIKMLLKELILEDVFHGTPHNFNQFDVEYIGDGEGNQSYGWGLYFTDNIDIAKFYRDSLAKKHKVKTSSIYNCSIPDSEYYLDYNNLLIDQPKILNIILNKNNVTLHNKIIKSIPPKYLHDENAFLIDNTIIDKYNENIENFKFDIKEGTDYLILNELFITYLHNNKYTIKNILSILNSQSIENEHDNELLSIYKYYITKLSQHFNENFIIKRLSKKDNYPYEYIKGYFEYLNGKYFYQTLCKASSPRYISLALLDAGIIGIKYLNNTGNSHNYVIFDHKFVTIKDVQQISVS